MRLSRPSLALSCLACSAGFFQTATAFTVSWPRMQGRGILQPRVTGIVEAEAVPSQPSATSVMMIEAVPTPPPVTIFSAIEAVPTPRPVSTVSAFEAVPTPPPVSTVSALEAVPTPPPVSTVSAFEAVPSQPVRDERPIMTHIGGIRPRPKPAEQPAFLIEPFPSQPVGDEQPIMTHIGGIRPRPQSAEQTGSPIEAVPSQPVRDENSIMTHIGGIRPRPKSPPPPPSPPLPPPEVVKSDPLDPPGNLRCEPAPKERYLDSPKWSVTKAAKRFCREWANPAGEHDPDKYLPIQRTVFHWNDEYGPWKSSRHHEKVHHIGNNINLDAPAAPINPHKSPDQDSYDFSITRVKGCEMRPGAHWNFTEPLVGEECRKLMPRAWHECYNLKRGGSIQAGCLWYNVRRES